MNRNQAAKRILVVDDEPQIVGLITKWLVQWGYAVAGASDGVDALEKLRASSFDLVVTDVMMPNMDGVELLREMRSDPALCSVPVCMLGWRAEDSRDHVQEWAWGIGADGGFDKPFNPSQLCDYIDRLLFGESGKP